MNKFNGFTDSETFTQLPDSFFNQLLNEIVDADELKVTLYAIWRIEHIDGPFRALCETDFDVKDLSLAASEVALGLEKATQRGSLLKSAHEADVFYFLNSPRGQRRRRSVCKRQLARIRTNKVRTDRATECVQVV